MDVITIYLHSSSPRHMTLLNARNNLHASLQTHHLLMSRDGLLCTAWTMHKWP